MDAPKKMSLGDRMKLYEDAESRRMLMPLLPICARLDGKCFHKFTKGMDTPYSVAFREMMLDVTTHLVDESCASIGYTQSDEISLVWAGSDFKSQTFFDGRISKIVSVLAAMASVKFFDLVVDRMPEKRSMLPVFDCRVWNVPTEAEAVNTLLWRERDASKNSITSAALCFYSHKEIEGKNGSDKQEMLFKKGVNWNDYPAFFRRGTYVQRRKVERKFLPNEIERLPEKHEARRNPDLMVVRTDIVVLGMPPIASISNAADVVFRGCDPIPISCGPEPSRQDDD